MKEVTFHLRDYLVPNGKYPYSQLATDMTKVHKDGNKCFLISVPGLLIGTNYPDVDDYQWSDCDGTVYLSASDLLAHKNGKYILSLDD